MSLAIASSATTIVVVLVVVLVVVFPPTSIVVFVVLIVLFVFVVLPLSFGISFFVPRILFESSILVVIRSIVFLGCL